MIPDFDVNSLRKHQLWPEPPFSWNVPGSCIAVTVETGQSGWRATMWISPRKVYPEVDHPSWATRETKSYSGTPPSISASGETWVLTFRWKSTTTWLDWFNLFLDLGNRNETQRTVSLGHWKSCQHPGLHLWWRDQTEDEEGRRGGRLFKW